LTEKLQILASEKVDSEKGEHMKVRKTYDPKFRAKGTLEKNDELHKEFGKLQMKVKYL
jgi:hypothetical protein